MPPTNPPPNTDPYPMPIPTEQSIAFELTTKTLKESGQEFTYLILITHTDEATGVRTRIGIKPDGNVEIEAPTTFTEAAQQFWDAVGNYIRENRGV